ncbi:hypothetical protein AAG906_005793 [Vitis piasezkii]
MARAFKKRVKPRPLQRSELVLKVIKGLIRDPRGKFRPNWSGHYFIRELTLKGAAWLMDLDGNRFSEPTNVDQLRGTIGALLEPFNQARTFQHLDVTILPLLSPLVGPIFSDVVMILGYSYLRCIDSRIIISTKYSCGDDCFLRGLLQSTLLGRGMFIHVEGHSLDDVRQDEPLVEHDLRAIFSFWRSEPSFTFRRSEPSPIYSLTFRESVRSLVFKATVYSQLRRSKLSFSACHRSHIQAFRAIISPQFGVQNLHFSSVQHSEPPSLSSSAHHLFSVMTFRATISFQFGRSEPPFLFSLAFKVTILSQSDVQRHHPIRSGIRCHLFNIQSYIHDIQSRRSRFGV